MSAYYFGLSVPYSSRTCDQSCYSNIEEENQNCSEYEVFFLFLCFFFLSLERGCYRLLCPRKHKEGCLHCSLDCSCKNAQVRLSKQCYCRSTRLAWLIALNPRLLSDEFGLFSWEFFSSPLICCTYAMDLYLRYLSF